MIQTIGPVGMNRLAISLGDVQQAAGVLAQVKDQAAHPLALQVGQRLADLDVAFLVELAAAEM